MLSFRAKPRNLTEQLDCRLFRRSLGFARDDRRVWNIYKIFIENTQIPLAFSKVFCYDTVVSTQNDGVLKSNT